MFLFQVIMQFLMDQNNELNWYLLYMEYYRSKHKLK